MAASIQSAVTKNTIEVRNGTMPTTRRMPGEVAKPIVRISSPVSDWVPGSGSQRAPIR